MSIINICGMSWNFLNRFNKAKSVVDVIVVNLFVPLIFFLFFWLKYCTVWLDSREVSFLSKKACLKWKDSICSHLAFWSTHNVVKCLQFAIPCSTLSVLPIKKPKFSVKIQHVERDNSWWRKDSSYKKHEGFKRAEGA